MLNFYKSIEILVTIQTLIISTMLPAYIPLPFFNQSSNSIEIPITWQIPTTILLTLVFNRKVLIRAFTIYMICGIFIFPVFHHGGSLGYMLTPYFGFLLGTYPLIIIIDNLKKKNKINIFNFLINGFLAILAMHLTGIFYNLILLIFHKQFNIFLYNLGKYYVGNVGYHLIMLIPLILVIKPVNFLKYNKR
tara:strand:+ start:27 stop:599 length:573 start_codon:yes stop_codon:yes gene_type:complete